MIKLGGPKGPIGPHRTKPTDDAHEYTHEDFPSAGLPQYVGGENWQLHPDYVKLPEAIKAHISPRDYSTMPDAMRNSLMQDMVLPEVGEDD